MSLCVCVCVCLSVICTHAHRSGSSQSPQKKQTDTCCGEQGSCPRMTLSMFDCACVDWINTKRTIQSSGNKGLCCTSPYRAIWCALPASLTAAVRWSTFRQGWAVSPRLHLQSTSDKQSYFFSQLPVSPSQPQKYTDIFSFSFSVSQWPG